MIFRKNEIPDNFHIEFIKPDIIVRFDLKKDEIINENDVTCVFLFHPKMQPGILNVMGIKFYETVNNTILEEYSVGGNKPYQVYIYKGKPFNIEFIKEKYINLK
ncbi:hypothetical protein MG290_01040 [Flavobacterium sp. CBA20B-1]|uniref:hypothetical protein n=1 Tax=unclassified Flavobacterium TaxID=196869 RepID=UPI002225804A|nr:MULTISPECIES: hypothetical protein [unclassified Flavobacterium]WCM42286.1 hypothetical protein MG290_01040 [Flavobacterium sp. CBA20B-1]